MFLLIDKPKGITSHDVVDRLRIITGEKRVGHAGTLDPNATGLLIVGIGRSSTKKLNILSSGRKTYIGVIILGKVSDTDDAEGKVSTLNTITGKISKIKIVKLLKQFVGRKKQVPPIYSAIKIKGKKAYELARDGTPFELKARSIEIYSIKLLEYKYPKLTIETEVSGGTYIRALARDIGDQLGTGAYLVELRRTKIAKFKIENSLNLDNLNKDKWKDLAIETI